MGPSQTSETKAYIRLVMGTLTMITALTAVNVLIIMNSLGTNLFMPLHRNLASVAAAPVKLAEKVASPIIEINCRKKRDTLHIKTQASSVRLYFNHCRKIGAIINESNNSHGDAFPLKGKAWTSDFIPLQIGDNQVKVDLKNGTQTIEIIRKESIVAATNKAL